MDAMTDRMPPPLSPTLGATHAMTSIAPVGIFFHHLEKKCNISSFK